MKRIGVLTSGGDSPGMNAAIRAVVRAGLYHGLEVYGIKRGYAGLIEGDIEEMSRSSVSDIMQRGGTILYTARCDEFTTPEGRKKAIMMMQNFRLEGLVVIGGDGSFKGAKSLAEEGICTIGLPGTIDNDLAYTDYTIGFDTAVNTALAAIGNLRDTSSAHGRATIVELMGRHCGDIALFAGIGSGAEVVIVPEDDFDPLDICRQIVEGKNRGKRHCLIIIAEGAVVTSEELRAFIAEHTGMDSRVTVLGHVQRGGTPTNFDRMIASRMGAKAIQLLMEGKSGRAVGIKGNEIVDYDIHEALAMPRKPNEELIELAKILSI